ncbi:MAG: YceI family protein [Acidimicrobiaceae bacterium]|nr:YceI family protein [Acidimicrobiaceae bacterium]
MTRFRIVPDQSRVWIDARSNIHPIHSSTDGLEGYVDLDVDPDGTISVDGSPQGHLSLRVTRLSSGSRLEDREMQNRIDAERYPTIDGVLGEMQPAGRNGTFRVSGEVTFRGVTQRHEDQMKVSVLDTSTIKLEGASRFNVRDFGMEPPRMLMLRVEPDVDVRVEIVAMTEDDNA